MPTIWEAASRHSLVARLERLTPDAAPAWGTFNAAGMAAHLHDALRMALGELPVAPTWIPLRYPPIRQLFVYYLPMPKGAPTSPELIARCTGADLARERDAVKQAMDRVAAGAPLVPHPAFGNLSRAEWGALIYKHTDHHLRQFGL